MIHELKTILFDFDGVVIDSEPLQAETRTSIVIEDSPNGIISAKSAGCFVYGITSSFIRQTLLEAGADEVVDSFEDLSTVLGF
jgi:beta-phosphoglucomutase